MNQNRLNSEHTTEEWYRNCRLCPRNCGVNRRIRTGFCGSGADIRAARAGLHYYEEPFLSGSQGSGTVFFSGCSLGCVYCQNGQISHNLFGIDISVERLAEIFLEQQGRGAHNINLVTGTHFTPSIASALQMAKVQGLTIPVVWNSSGYEKADTLRMLEGLVDIFMPDFKTLSPELGMRYMKASDYPEQAMDALQCMAEMAGHAVFEKLSTVSPETAEMPKTMVSPKTAEMPKTAASAGQTGLSVSRNKKETTAGVPEFDKSPELYPGEGVLMRKGLVVRHLVVPGQTEDSKAVLRYLQETYGDQIWISLMSQYTPVGVFAEKEDPFAQGTSELLVREMYPELCRKLSAREYDEVVDYAISLGIENCMIQEEDVASDSFIPDFDGSGIRRG